MKTSISFTSIVAALLVVCLFAPAVDRAIAQTNQNPQMQLSLQQINQLKTRSKSIRTVGRLLSERNVPIEARHLFSKNWRTRLSASVAQLPEMRISRSHTSSEIRGVEIADELTLPENIRLTGDTVIIARRIRFQGRDVRITGGHGLHVFAIESVSTTDAGGSITVDTSGRGRREWLESVQASRLNQTEPLNFGFVKASYRFPLLQDNSGQNGTDGANGQDGNGGANGNDGSNGQNGSCFADLNGSRGLNGTAGAFGSDGNGGGDGAPGADGQPITLDIATLSDTTSYVLISKGGDGGYGGRGG